jgi:hypothetical protein
MILGLNTSRGNCEIGQDHEGKANEVIRFDRVMDEVNLIWGKL